MVSKRFNSPCIWWCQKWSEHDNKVYLYPTRCWSINDNETPCQLENSTNILHNSISGATKNWVGKDNIQIFSLIYKYYLCHKLIALIYGHVYLLNIVLCHWNASKWKYWRTKLIEKMFILGHRNLQRVWLRFSPEVSITRQKYNVKRCFANLQHHKLMGPYLIKNT